MDIYKNNQKIISMPSLDDAIMFCRGCNYPVKKYNLTEIERYKHYLLQVNDITYTLLEN